ncbi:MAG: ADP-ribosylglycohydrolase family protein [Nanoarchaeota archaeon]|nr:ADP-ribosylglycohydrolase family protein [Nanoarchaeota archaeon]
METKNAERYTAVLIGCAIGDTLGMPVEAWKKEQIRKYAGRITKPIDAVVITDSNGNLVMQDEFGKLKYYNKGLKAGQQTDDTILTMALADSIAEKQGIDLEDIAKKQLREYEIRIQPDGKVLGGFGGTTRDAFKNLQKGISPLKSGVIGGPGNAPAMKMSPLGLYMHATGNYEEGLKAAEAIGRITHLDPRSVASGIVQAHCVYALLKGVSRDDFVGSFVEVCRKREAFPAKEFSLSNEGTLLERLKWIQGNMDAEPEAAFQKLGSSSLVYSSYPFALFMFQKYWDKPIEGLLETVNYGGDCDTTGAMYGALAGAKNGMIFPEEWAKVIDGLKRIKSTAKKISKIGGN